MAHRFYCSRFFSLFRFSFGLGLKSKPYLSFTGHLKYSQFNSYFIASQQIEHLRFRHHILRQANPLHNRQSIAM